MPETDISGGAIDAPSSSAIHRSTFANEVLPLLASLLIHAAVITLGIAAVHAVRTVVAGGVREQLIIPEMGPLTPASLSGVPQQAAANSERLPAQEIDPETQSTGLNDRAGHDLSNALSSGSSSDATNMPLAVGAGSRMIGAAGRGGTGEGGPLAPFGVPGGSNGSGVSFCNGLTVNARRIAFVCDASGSMMSKFDLLRVELRKAIEMLRLPQSFSVIFFQETTCTTSDAKLLLATPECKRKAYDFVDRTAARSGTDPLPAIRLAFQQGAELIYLLTDGDFPDNDAVIQELRKLNSTKKVKVNTLAFIDRDESYEKVLKQIAAENGGSFRFVSENDLGN